MTAPRAAELLSASGLPWFWLDGESAAPGEPRVSYLGVASEVREAERGSEQSFLASLRAGAAPTRPGGQPGQPGQTETSGAPFAGGWIVALGYEFGVALLGGDPHPDDAAPAFALRVDAVLAVDHDTGAAQILRLPAAVGAVCAGGAAEAAERLGSLLACAPARMLPSATPRAEAQPAAAWRGADYEGRVEECLAAIHRGDAYVLCLTDTAEASTRATPLALYERLREGAMRGGVISVPGRALVSASPERFLSVRGRSVSTHPIKGTRARGATEARDRELAAELGADPKERAENLMIVDLMRNDLSRVCAPGTVRVARFLAVETHPRVHQLVSTVAGELEAGLDVFDAIAACFPGGSMTGAPKQRAVEILAGLEGGPRGLYSGCFGWIADSGDAELAMTIRGVELRGGGIPDPRAEARALVGAGGGITVDSVPASERGERDLKAAAMLANL